MTEQRIVLDKFIPRSYQLPIIEAIESKGYKHVLAILPRRAGKDITGFNICIRALLRKVMVIYYIFPTYSQGKKILWDSITNTGEKILDYIPKELVESMNSQEMKIKFINGSLFQIVGSDNFNSLMGTNPQGVVFSEYSLQDPRAYQYIRPILTANKGWALFLSTPRGKNHLWELYNIALQSPSWFCYKLTLDDTQHIPFAEIERERADGIMSEDLIQQEYYTSFSLGVEGSYYSKYIAQMRVNGRIGVVPWENGIQVHSVWDIGHADSTCIIMYQICGQTVRIIDCYENNKQGLEHYVDVIKNKPYSWGKHFAPHDISVTEWGSGISRLEKARQLGLKFEYKIDKNGRARSVLPDLSIMDGIEAVRSLFSRCWIDEDRCAGLLKALENYRQEYDIKLKVYNNKPLHNWASHYCFTADTMVLTRTGIRPIIEVTDNDEIMTLYGWEKCIGAKSFRKNANVVQVTFADGVKVKCTPDHLFLTEKGWISAESLNHGMIIQSSLQKSNNNMVDGFIDYGGNDTYSNATKEGYIKMYGEMLMETFHLKLIYIIKIMIDLIMHARTLFVYQQKNISNLKSLSILDCQTKPEQQLLNGINQMREENGTRVMHAIVNHGKSKKGLKDHAYFVERRQCFYNEKQAVKDSAIPTVKHLMVEEVERLEEKHDVWCINVPKAGHFSLANGAIVHNSDSARYLALSLPRTRDGVTKEELDNQFARAVYGTEGNLPPFFR